MKRRWITGVLGAVVAVCIAAPPAGAHNDTGTIEVVSVTAPAALSLRIEASITYTDDGHAAAAATATVVAERAGAPSVGPVALTATSTAGRYGATITVPTAGDWTLRITSLSPAAVIERRETVSAPPTTVVPTTAVATTVVPATTTPASGGVGPLTSTAAPSTSVGAPGDPAPVREAGKDRFATTVAFIGILVAIAIVAALAVRSARRGRQNGAA